MKAAERKMWVEHHKKWLSEDHRLDRWNHVRHRAGLPDLTLEQAAQLLTNPTLYRDVKEYIDGE